MSRASGIEDIALYCQSAWLSQQGLGGSVSWRRGRRFPGPLSPRAGGNPASGAADTAVAPDPVIPRLGT